MRYIRRHLEEQIRKAVKGVPAVVLTGPRRAGKTWMLRHLFPEASYFLLEDPDIVARLRADPHGFLDAVKTPAILDEVQNVPEVFAFVRSRIDRRPRRAGQWLLTGSQEAPLMQGVSDSMAGRAAVFQLHPLSTRETPKVTLLHGGYPEAVARPAGARLWFSSYLQTYLERDVRAVTAVKDLATFRRFLALLASRHGQMLNRTDLAAPLGVSVPTITQWLGVLETTAQVLIVPPFYENLGKRLVKSPKVYLADSGLACHLLGIDTAAELARSPFLGALFEGFIASEIVKGQVNAGRRRELYHFRDEQGLEVDFVVPGRAGSLSLVECRATRTVTPAIAAPIQRLAGALKKKRSRGTAVDMFLVHQAPQSGTTTPAIAPGVRALPWRDFLTKGAVTSVRALALAAILLLVGATRALAGDTQAEFAPELDAYLKLSDRTRLFFLGSLGQSLSESSTTGLVGAHLDITLMPILRRQLQDADWERERYLWVRIGYQQGLGNLDVDRDDRRVEHRGVLEANTRVPLPSDVWLVSRARVDLRDLDGEFSTRFRFRLGVEREFTVGDVPLVPYARAEVFYDTRFGGWNRQIYQAGVEIEITKHWRIEPYYARQEDQRSSPAHLDRVGLVLKTYW